MNLNFRCCVFTSPIWGLEGPDLEQRKEIILIFKYLIMYQSIISTTYSTTKFQ